MAIRKTGFGKADRYAEALEELQAEADHPRGFEASEIAVRAASLDESYMAARRFMNRVLGYVGVDRSETPKRPPFLTYGRAETSASLGLLKSAGVIESGVAVPPLSGIFGAPEEDPDARVIYRLAVAEAGEAVAEGIPTRNAEISPLRDTSGPHMM